MKRWAVGSRSVFSRSVGSRSVGQWVGRRWMGVGLLLAALAGWVVMAAPVGAATITVTTTADELNSDGDCSLREAIRAANTDAVVDACAAGSGTDTIVVPAGNYVFDAALGTTGEDLALFGDLDIRQDVTISGAGQTQTIINAAGIDRVFHIHLPADVDITGATITGGDAHDAAGGGIYVGGSLDLINSRVTGNTTGPGATAGFFSGGGVIFYGPGASSIVSSRIDDNTSTNSGGGVYHGHHTYANTLLIRNSRIDGNEALSGGGIQSVRPLTIIGSLVDDNFTNSNSSGGGGIDSTDSLTLINSTLSGNSAANSGGALTVGGGSAAVLNNVTISGNTADSDASNQGDGGGIRIASGTVSLKNTIIAGNSDASPAGLHPDCSGVFDSQDYNLIGDAAGCTLNGVTTHNLVGVKARLGALRDNGGPTLTHALQANSPAIDAGNPAGCHDPKGVNLTVDQRGYVRPADGDGSGGALCDMGAFEYRSPGAPTPTPTRTPTATATPTTPAPTATATTTPPPTATATKTPTATATPSPTPTKIATATRTPSPTPTKVSSDTPPAVTATPTATATASPTATPTRPCVDCPPATATATPTATATATPSPTATLPCLDCPPPPSPTPFTPTEWIYLPIGFGG